jgi:hypothetical protein
MRAWQQILFWFSWTYLGAVAGSMVYLLVTRQPGGEAPGWVLALCCGWLIIQPACAVAVIVDIIGRSSDRGFRTTWILLTLFFWPSTLVYYFRHGVKPHLVQSTTGPTAAIPALAVASGMSAGTSTSAAQPQTVAEAPGSTASLICGAVGMLGAVFCVPFVAAVPALIYGHQARRAIRRSGGALSGKGKSTAGLVLGYTALLLAVAIGGIIIFGLIRFLRDETKNSTDQLAGEPGFVEARAAEAAMSRFAAGPRAAGNTAEARRLATEISGTVRAFQMSEFTRPASFKDERENAPRVYCHLGPDHCAILIAPQMDPVKWEAQAEKEYEKGLWVIVHAVIATSNELPEPPTNMQLALGIWGGWQYRRLFFGPLAEKLADDSVPPFESPGSALDPGSKRRFYSFFAPEQPIKAEGDVRPQ